MSNLTILNSSIRQLDGLYSLNDLHKISGNEDKHLPFRFMRLDQTQELITEIQSEFKTPDLVFKITKGRGIQGTYACKELVIAYAAWISPQFHLVVLRAFLDKLGNSQNSQQNLPLVLPPKKYTFEFTEDELQSLAWSWFAFIRGIHTFRYIYPMFQKLGSNMAAEIYGQGFEYSHTAQSAHKILERITKDFDCDPMTNWRVLKHVRGFDPAFKKPTF